MPELPEVEVVRAGLERHVLGATVTRVDVLHPRPVRRDPTGPGGFALALTGRRIEAARRRGKYLWLPLDNGDALLGHLGMSGQLLVQPAGAPDERHLRVRFVLEAPGPGTELRFVDQRMFGGLSVSVGGAELPAEIAHIARDALGQGGTSFDALYVNVNGQSGYFDRSLHAYGREGEPCDRCGRPIRRIAFMNRSSYFCPGCQPVPRVRRASSED